MPGLKDDLQTALVRLNQSAPEIRASAFVSLDGLMLASALPQNTNEDTVAAMSAAVLGLGERTTREFAVGTLRQVYFRGDEGFILLQAAGDDGVLVVVTDSSAKLGILFLLLNRTGEELRTIVKQAISFPGAPAQTSAFESEQKPDSPTQETKPTWPSGG